MARGIRRGVVAVLSVTGALAFTALAGCSAASETTGETDEALPRAGGGGTGGGGGRIIIDPPPVCPPHGENDYKPPSPISPGNWCSPNTDSFFDSRSLSHSAAFEDALLAAGCTGRVRGLGSGPPVPPGGVGWSWTTCADSCAVRLAVRQFHGQNPFVAMTSDVRVTACSGVPAAGEVFVLWDPYCPSGCSVAY
jgi:hypothetical protein